MAPHRVSLLCLVLIALPAYILMHKTSPNAAIEESVKGGASRDPHVICRKCGQTLAHTSDYSLPPASSKLKFATSAPELGDNGRVLHFENSHNYKHGLVTFSKAENIAMSAKGSLKDTYFPGYAWRPITCSHCKSHVGWMFQEPNLPEPSAQSLHPVHPKPKPKMKRTGDLSPLGGLCQTLPQGWWTYEWCHQVHVRQFHREPDGTVVQDWSLGAFDALGSKKLVVDVTDATVAMRSPHFIHSFIGGQPCEETGSQRQTQVHFACCRKDRGPHIESVEETEICQYKMVMCVPSLCDEPDTSDSVIPKKSAPPRAIPSGNINRFYGLLWNQVMLTSDEALWWVDSVEPVTAISH